MQKKPMTLTTGEIKINQFYVKSISPRYHSSMSLAQVHATLPLCHWTLVLWSYMSLADTSPELTGLLCSSNRQLPWLQDKPLLSPT